MSTTPTPTPESPSAWRTTKRRCPICGKHFLPTKRWQEYDRAACRQRAKRDRIAARKAAEQIKGETNG